MIGELCDDGDLDNTNGCKSDCSGPVSGYVCQFGTATSPMICSEKCGDFVITISETCDDGNMISNDGCSINCLTE